MTEQQPTEQTQTQQQSAATTEPAPQKEAGFFLPKEELVDFRREVRQVKDLLKSIAPGAAAAPPEGTRQQQAQATSGGDAGLRAELDSLRSEIAFEKALARSGLPFSPEQRSLLESAYHHQKPAHEQMGEWIGRTAAAMGVRGQQQAVTAIADPPRAKAPDNNTGAPARSPDGAVKDPRVFARENPEAWARMDASERDKWVQEHRRQTGQPQRIIAAHLRK